MVDIGGVVNTGDGVDAGDFFDVAVVINAGVGVDAGVANGGN